MVIYTFGENDLNLSKKLMNTVLDYRRFDKDPDFMGFCLSACLRELLNVIAIERTLKY